MEYAPLQRLRRALLEEVKEEFNGLPLTVEHYQLVETRLQTALSLSLGEAADKVEAQVEKARNKRIGKETKP
jgi:hemoglobin-like flavoprotein